MKMLSTFSRVALAVVVALGQGSSATAGPSGGFDPVADAKNFTKLFYRYNHDKPDRAITLSPNGALYKLGPKKGAGHVGVGSKQFDLDGDFMFEVKYEMLTLPEKINEGYGVFFGISAEYAAHAGGASVTRVVPANAPHRYGAGRYAPKEKGTHYASQIYPTETRAGRLGLRRVNGEVTQLVSDTPDGDFEELHRYPLPGPIASLAAFADTGGAAVELGVRVYDFRVTLGRDVPPAPEKKRPGGVTRSPWPPPGQPVVAAPAPTAAPRVVATAEPVPKPTPAPAGVPWLLSMLTFAVGVGVGVALLRWREAR